jgi:hypothetical protein
MTDAVAVSAITVIGGIVVAVVTVFGNKMGAKQDKMKEQMDGRLTELLELTRKSSHAEGVKDQVEMEKGHK